MDWSKGEYNPWVAGWLLGKYEQYTRVPAESEFDEWIDGFTTGCAENGEHHIWDVRLRDYTINCRIGSLEKCGRNSV